MQTGALFPRTWSLNRPFTQSKIKAVWETYSQHPQETALQWLWRCWETRGGGIQLIAQQSKVLGGLGPMPLVNTALCNGGGFGDQLMEGYVKKWSDLADLKNKYPRGGTGKKEVINCSCLGWWNVFTGKGGGTPIRLWPLIPLPNNSDG